MYLDREQSGKMTSIWSLYDQCSAAYRDTLKSKDSIDRYLDYHNQCIAMMADVIDTYIINDNLQTDRENWKHIKDITPSRAALRPLYNALTELYQQYKLIELKAMFYQYYPARCFISVIGGSSETGVTDIMFTLELQAAKTGRTHDSMNFLLTIKPTNQLFRPCIIYLSPSEYTYINGNSSGIHNIPVNYPILMEDCLSPDGLIPVNPYSMFRHIGIESDRSCIPDPITVDALVQWIELRNTPPLMPAVKTYKYSYQINDMLSKFVQTVMKLPEHKAIDIILHDQSKGKREERQRSEIFTAYLRASVRNVHTYMRHVREYTNIERQFYDFIVYNNLDQLGYDRNGGWITEPDDLLSQNDLIDIIVGAIIQGNQNIISTSSFWYDEYDVCDGAPGWSKLNKGMIAAYLDKVFVFDNPGKLAYIQPVVEHLTQIRPDASWHKALEVYQSWTWKFEPCDGMVFDELNNLLRSYSGIDPSVSNDITVIDV